MYDGIHRIKWTHATPEVSSCPTAARAAAHRPVLNNPVASRPATAEGTPRAQVQARTRAAQLPLLLRRTALRELHVLACQPRIKRCENGVAPRRLPSLAKLPSPRASLAAVVLLQRAAAANPTLSTVSRPDGDCEHYEMHFPNGPAYSEIHFSILCFRNRFPWTWSKQRGTSSGICNQRRSFEHAPLAPVPYGLLYLLAPYVHDDTLPWHPSHGNRLV